MDKENFATGGCCAIQTRNQNAAQEEYLHADAMIAQTQPPEQASSQETVVQPLVGSLNFRGGSGFLGLAESAKPGGFVPKEHFKYEDINVHECDETDNHIGYGKHRISRTC